MAFPRLKKSASGLEVKQISSATRTHRSLLPFNTWFHLSIAVQNLKNLISIKGKCLASVSMIVDSMRKLGQILQTNYDSLRFFSNTQSYYMYMIVYNKSKFIHCDWPVKNWNEWCPNFKEHTKWYMYPSSLMAWSLTFVYLRSWGHQYSCHGYCML